jgi:hypothetical protein
MLYAPESLAFRVVDKTAGWRLVRKRPTKVDLDIDYRGVPDRQDLRVPKAVAVRCPAFVGDEYIVSDGHQTDKVEPGSPFAVGPAARKVRRPIDVIVKWACEVEFLSNQRFDRCAIFSDVGFVAGASDGH